jgi:CSLREA domain-containing protein
MPGWLRSVDAASFAVSVTTPADINDACATTGAAPCSLRDAIRYANSHMARGDTTTITLPAGIYNLTQTGPCEDAAVTGDLDITQNVILNGADPATTIIDGMGSDRIFAINASTLTVSIANVTVRNGFQGVSCGSTGGGIAMVGNVTLTNVVVTNNTARADAGIRDDGTLTLINSTVSNNRGCGASGISQLAGAPLTLINSTVSGNYVGPNPVTIDCPGSTRGLAAGINATFNTHLTNSTISGNTNAWNAADDAGGIRNSNALTISYSTITGNTMAGGSSSAAGVLNRASGSTTIQGSIVAGNGSGNCTNVGTLTSQGYNVSDDASCALTRPTDLPNTNPNLGPLASNGGPTQTHALLPGSPAIDKAPAVSAGCPATDQRGVARPSGQACDSGAYEFISANVLPGPKTPGQSGGIPMPMPMPNVTGSPVAGSTPAPLPVPRRP